MVVRFVTGAIGEDLKPLRERLTAPTAIAFILAAAGWPWLLGRAHFALEQSHSVIFLILELALLAVPMILAEWVADGIWIRLIILPWPRWINFYKLIHLIVGLIAAFILVATMDAIGLLGNRPLLH